MSALLPKDDTEWPPRGVANRYRRMDRTLAWYSGDPSRLRSEYGVRSSVVSSGSRTTLNPGGGEPRVTMSNANAFWATSPAAEIDTRRHLPIAQDVATMSADLLFSEPPTIRVLGPVDAEGQPTAETLAAQQRLDTVLEACNFQAQLLASAEIGSPAGAACLRIAFDKSAPAIKDRPVVTRVNPRAAIPHYSWGQLIGVTFWRVVEGDAERDVYWRHLEHHEMGTGRVYHALYKGSSQFIGKRRPLTEHEATRGLEDEVTLVQGGNGSTAICVPNMLPDPLDVDDDAGRSDYTLPVMDLFDAADRVYTQFMDELDDAKSRLFIADSLLDSRGAGKGVSFDADQRVFRKVNMPPAESESGKLPIEKVQFDIRVEQYLAALEALTYKAVDAAGYNPNTEREQDGAAMTATEYSGRNRKSMTTRDKKVRYWQPQLEALLSTLLRVDVEQFAPFEQVTITSGEGETATSTTTSVKVQPYPVEVRFPEAVQPTLLDLANTAKALKDAGESVLEIQRVLHPDWTERQLQQNVERIQSAASVIDPVSFGVGGVGVGSGDGV